MKKRSEMNEYQEALKNIRPIICELASIGTHDGTEREYKYIDSEEYILLHILVDKETPMKPIKGDGFKVHDCPTCDDGYIEVENYYKLNRCVNCGQRIDWTDVRKMEEEER